MQELPGWSGDEYYAFSVAVIIPPTETATLGEFQKLLGKGKAPDEVNYKPSPVDVGNPPEARAPRVPHGDVRRSIAISKSDVEADERKKENRRVFVFHFFI